MADSIQKFFSSKIVELNRSEIHPSQYNPRMIDEEGKKMLKRSLKNFGVVGGICVNKRTGNTIVGGHQKVYILDDIFKYPENDYKLRVEIIDVDEKTEKELNIALNNPNVGGTWDYDALRELIPEIDYKSAGLTEADLNMIGCDFLLQTEAENQIGQALTSMMEPIQKEHEAEKEARRIERQQVADSDNDNETSNADGEDLERQARIQHMKDVKQIVREGAENNVKNMEAYVMLSFDNWEAKAAFCQRFGYSPYDKFIKGEVFDEQVERIEWFCDGNKKWLSKIRLR